jgi:hypothetical protein
MVAWNTFPLRNYLFSSLRFSFSDTCSGVSCLTNYTFCYQGSKAGPGSRPGLRLSHSPEALGPQELLGFLAISALVSPLPSPQTPRCAACPLFFLLSLPPASPALPHFYPLPQKDRSRLYTCWCHFSVSNLAVIFVIKAKFLVRGTRSVSLYPCGLLPVFLSALFNV